MEGFVLAAGLGTRLRPLTDDRPKALVEVGGRTLLDRCIHRLADAGVRRVVVNVHHFGDMVIDYLGEREWPCEVAVSDERSLLLDTGGALRHAAPLFSGQEPVLVHNVDVLSRIDLAAAVAAHEANGDLATLCVSRRDTKRLLSFSPDGRLIGRYNSELRTPNSALRGMPRELVERTPLSELTLAFSGISVVSPALFPLLPEDDHPYPIIDEYIRLTATHRIGCFVHEADDWLDVGKPETLEQAQRWNLS